jgi:hypothetical protein
MVDFFQNEIIISSRDRETGTTDNFTVRMNNITHIEKLSIRKIVIPLTWYPINQYNNRLDFNDGVLRPITIPEGVYTATSLAAEIQSQMNASPSALTFTVVFNNVTKKITINETSGPTNFILDLNIANSIYEVIGFAQSTLSGAATYTGPNTVDINQNNHVINVFSNTLNRFDRRVHSSDKLGQTIREANTQTSWGGLIDLESFQSVVLNYDPNSGMVMVDMRFTDTNNNPITFTSGNCMIYLLAYTKV